MNDYTNRSSKEDIRKFSDYKSKSLPESDDFDFDECFDEDDTPCVTRTLRRPKSAHGRPRRSSAEIERRNSAELGRLARPGSSYGRIRRHPAHQSDIFDCNDNAIFKTAKCDSKTDDIDSREKVPRGHVRPKKVRPQSSYGRRTPVNTVDECIEEKKYFLDSSIETTLDSDCKNNKIDVDISSSFRERTNLSRNDILDKSKTRAYGRGRYSSPVNGDKIEPFQPTVSKTSLSSHRHRVISFESSDDSDFADSLDIFDTETEIIYSATPELGCKNEVCARNENPDSKQLRFHSETGRNRRDISVSQTTDDKVVDIYRRKHPIKKAFRLKPIDIKHPPLRSASESDTDRIVNELLGVNNFADTKPNRRGLAKQRSLPLGEIAVHSNNLIGSEGDCVKINETAEVVNLNPADLRVPENATLPRKRRVDFHNPCEQVDTSHANETSPWIRNEPIETTAKLGQLSINRQTAVDSRVDVGAVTLVSDHTSGKIVQGGRDEVELDETEFDYDKEYLLKEQRNTSHLDTVQKNEENILFSSPFPPKELPHPQRLSSKLHTRRFLRGRSQDEILPSYPVIVANGKTIRASSSKDSDSSEPNTPTSPVDLTMEAKLERNGSQKNRATPFTANPPRPSSSASTRPDSALADRPRTGQGSRSGSGREQRPARSIAQLKKLSSEEIDDLKDGKRSKLLRAQSLPEGGMNAAGKQSLAVMMDEIKECRYIRKQESTE